MTLIHQNKLQYVINYLMKQKSNVFTLFFLCSVNTFLYSQTTASYTPKINSIPTSPEAALLGRFGDIPIGYYTGTANISIPIYTIKEGDLEIPITLNYHNSGIKVSDQATWVGLGWDLSPGGSILQEVRGKRDELDNNLNYGGNPSGYNLFKDRINNSSPQGVNKNVAMTGYSFYEPCLNMSCDSKIVGSEAGDDAGEVIAALLVGSGQPDIYHYNFANYSGKFYINPETQQVVQIDKKTDIKFEKTTSGITITTLDGIKYVFNTVETAYEQGYYANSDKAGKTFKLSEIQLINGKKIIFSYIDAHFIDYNYSESTLLYDFFGGPSPVLGLNTQQSDIKILSSITTEDTTINFNLENRDDIIPNVNNNGNLKRLKSILITSAVTGRKIKAFEFGYSYFPYTTLATPNALSNPLVTSYEGALGKRLKLDSLKEIGYTDETTQVEDRTKPAYKFDYDLTNTMPLKISMAKDFWGYYNAQANLQLLPDLSYFDYPKQYLAQTNNSPFIYNYSGANRYTDNSMAGTYLLNKITYPTGGYTQFEYEPNSFNNQFIPDIAKNNLAYKNYYVLDNNDVNNTLIKTFTLSKSVGITFSNVISATNINRAPWTYLEMSGCYIEFTKTKPVNGTPTTTLIKRWDLSTVLNVDFTNNSGKQWYETIQVPYDSSPSVTYSVKVFMPDNLNYAENYYHSASVNSRFTYNDDTGIDTSISNQCGMRIKSVKNFDRPGNLISNKQLSYYGGKLLNRFDPIDVLSEAWYFSCTPPAPGYSCPNFVEHGPLSKLSISSDNLISEGGNLIGYDKVEETEMSTNTQNNIGKRVFNYYNFDNVVSKNYPVFPNLRNGLIWNEYVYDNLNQLLTQKTYNYTNLNSGLVYYYGIAINTHFFGPDPHERAILGGRHKYSYNVYPISSEWNLLDNTVTKQYYGTNFLTSTESYTYNSEGNIRTKSTTNSNNDQLSTTFYYANDNPEQLAIKNTMTAAKMIGIPLVTENRKNTQLLSRQIIEYAKDATTSNFIYPKFVYAGKGINDANTASTEKKVTYDKYDSKGNIQQYTLEGGTSVTILWGYNKTLPIAKIENATYSQVAAALGITTTVLDTYDESKLSLINPLRSNANLVNSPINTYTYRPLIGVSTITDPKSDIMTYNYDALGRLITIRDKDNNIVSENKYQYKN